MGLKRLYSFPSPNPSNLLLLRSFTNNQYFQINSIFNQALYPRCITTDKLIQRYGDKNKNKLTDNSTINNKKPFLSRGGVKNLSKNVLEKEVKSVNVNVFDTHKLQRSLTHSNEFPKDSFLKSLENLKSHQSIKKILCDLGISETTLTQTLPKFIARASDDLIEGCKYHDCVTLYTSQGFLGVDRHFLKHFIDFVAPLLSAEEKQTFEYYRNLADLSNPGAWFPKTRRMRRKIIMHVGPTNSGKTYNALKSLGSSRRGIYCGPLRLLAYEVWKRYADQGIQCDLVTGEEKIRFSDYHKDPSKYNSLSTNGEIVSGATGPIKVVNPDQLLVSATTEMLSVNTVYDVAVLDEIQLIGDQQRGWGWTRALLGVQAKEIHLCGEPSAVNIVKSICAELHEEVEVHEYKRLSPLSIAWKSLDGLYKNLKPGDCFVAFSRNNIFLHKMNIEKKTRMKCAVVYGRMPPENRAHQARLFNDPDSPYKIMVASDAVGMGLNLNIQRVIFEELKKFDGQEVTKVPVPQVKQIAGRAGRFNTAYANGVATTFLRDDINYLNEAMGTNFADITKIGIQPETEALKIFSHQFPKDNLSQLLVKYQCLISMNSRYFLCFSDAHMKICNLISLVPLTLEDRHQFLLAPINPKDSSQSAFVIDIAKRHAAGRHIFIDDIILIPQKKFGPIDPSYLETLEGAHKCVTIYLWLSFRFPQTFIDFTRAVAIKSQLEQEIHESLAKVVPKPQPPRPSNFF